ncbi:MAG: hypothetical protein IPG96_07565 [Proteobacteria bacterium]|nr:hypothetical protein [Pseudomonadota bacterium]
MACWGRNDRGQATPPPGEFSSVSAGNGYACGVRTNGTLACWGSDTYGKAAAPLGGTFSSVSAGNQHTCAVRSTGTVTCWGDNSEGAYRAAAGVFRP